MKIALVFLTKNEITGLTRLFAFIPLKIFDEVFAVDGGSKDGTLEFFSGNNIRVLNQSSKGRGEAFRMAFEMTQCDAIVFFSPDGNEDPQDLPKFREYLNQGYDMAIASRMMKGAYNEEDDRLLKLRKWANLAFNGIANFLWNKGPFITDTINGYRAVTKKCFELTKADTSGYTIEYQLTIRSMKKNLQLIEFPTKEGMRIGGMSGAKALPTGAAFLKLLMREIIIGKNF